MPRKPLPDDEALSETVRARITRSEAAAVELYAADHDLSRGQVVRDALHRLLAEANPGREEYETKPPPDSEVRLDTDHPQVKAYVQKKAEEVLAKAKNGAPAHRHKPEKHGAVFYEKGVPMRARYCTVCHKDLGPGRA